MKLQAKSKTPSGPTNSTLVGQAQVFQAALYGLAVIGVAFAAGCESSTAPDVSDDAPSDPWLDYSPPPPTPEMETELMVNPAVYPHVKCIPYDESMGEVDPSQLKTAEDGSVELCIWHHPAGCAPEGLRFEDVGDCGTVRTTGPSWFIPPIQQFVSDPALLEDDFYRQELDWVRSQVASSGCACCHASDSGYASFYDIDAPGSWTDTLTMTGVVMAAGLATEHKYLGYLPPADNFGFDRETTIFATTDIPRMKAFFLDEFVRRGGTDEDIAQASAQFRQINNSLFMEPTECGPGEGLDAEGNIIWQGESARQIYIQEVNSQNPGSPPNLDKPEGTLWAAYSNPEADPMGSGTVKPGVVPSGARQAVPEDATQAPVFEDGRTYRLFITPDFLRSVVANCTFTFGETTVESEVKTCASDDTVCATLEIPETLTETPEKLVVALYKSLPPLGPPDVFPPYSVDIPELTPGGTYEVLMDAEASGTYYVYAVLYMPGGGLASWQAKPGVDYVATSDAISLDGRGLSLSEPILFDLVK